MTTPNIHDRINNDFAFHPARDELTQREHEDVRQNIRTVAHWLVDHTPPGREQSLMLTALEEAMHWANAAIAKQNPVG